MSRWWYSLLMLVAYLGIFHLWMFQDRPGIILSGCVWCLVFAGLAKANRSYFINRYDYGAHLVVVLDIFLEAVLIPVHDHYGFYLCAIAFTAAVGGYRRWAMKKLVGSERPTPNIELQTSSEGT